jgi:hypothetical protein
MTDMNEIPLGIPAPSPPDELFGYMAEKVKIIADIVGPITPAGDWETD